MNKILKAAVDPDQYDTMNPNWGNVVQGLENPSRAFYWEYISHYTTSWKYKNILDIGAGTGWLLDEAMKIGAEKAVGIDPSKNNINKGKELYPHLDLILTTFEKFITNVKFHHAIAIYTLTNIEDLDAFFSKLSKLLVKDGEFLTIVADFDYYKVPRFGYKITIEEINKDEYAALVKDSQSSTADIIRRISVYEESAKKAGMRLVEDIPMKPTKTYLEKKPKLIPFRDTPITHLLRFVNQSA